VVAVLDDSARRDDSFAMADGNVLEVCMGNDAGASLSVRAAHPVADVARDAGLVRGKIPQWKRVLVRTIGVGGSSRVWILEPGTEDNEIRFGAFYVRGRFAIADQSNNARKVEQLWKKTPPEG
jgi:hypothetical protein